jgi:hypothetical protein
MGLAAAADAEHEAAETNVKHQVEHLVPPKLLVSHKSEWLATSEDSLRHWYASQFRPYSCPKHLDYIVLCPDNECLVQACQFFFRELGCSYQDYGLGTQNMHPILQQTARAAGGGDTPTPGDSTPLWGAGSSGGVIRVSEGDGTRYPCDGGHSADIAETYRAACIKIIAMLKEREQEQRLQQVERKREQEDEMGMDMDMDMGVDMDNDTDVSDSSAALVIYVIYPTFSCSSASSFFATEGGGAGGGGLGRAGQTAVGSSVKVGAKRQRNESPGVDSADESDLQAEEGVVLADDKDAASAASAASGVYNATSTKVVAESATLSKLRLCTAIAEGLGLGQGEASDSASSNETEDTPSNTPVSVVQFIDPTILLRHSASAAQFASKLRDLNFGVYNKVRNPAPGAGAGARAQTPVPSFHSVATPPWSFGADDDISSADANSRVFDSLPVTSYAPLFVLAPGAEEQELALALSLAPAHSSNQASPRLPSLPWLPSMPPLPPLPSSAVSASSSSSGTHTLTQSMDTPMSVPAMAPQPAAPRVREGEGWILHGCYRWSTDGVWLFSGWTDCQGKMLHTFAVPIALTVDPATIDDNADQAAPSSQDGVYWGAAARSIWEQACSLVSLFAPTHSLPGRDETAAIHDEPPSSIVIASMGTTALCPMEMRAWESVIAGLGTKGLSAVAPVMILAVSTDASLQLSASDDSSGRLGTTANGNEASWLVVLPPSCPQTVVCDAATHTPLAHCPCGPCPEVTLLATGCLITAAESPLQRPCSAHGSNGLQQPTSILSPAMPIAVAIPSSDAMADSAAGETASATAGSKLAAESTTTRTLVASICIAHRPEQEPTITSCGDANVRSAGDSQRLRSALSATLRQYHALAWLAASSSGCNAATKGAAALPLHATAVQRLGELVAAFGGGCQVGHL